MKLIIAGGRKYNLTSFDILVLDLLHKETYVTEVVCGMAKGVDLAGKAWAKKRGIPVKEFQPNWAEFGPAAGPIRNREMAKYADAAILFPGGKGTNNMYLQAKSLNLTIFDYRNGDHNG